MITILESLQLGNSQEVTAYILYLIKQSQHNIIIELFIFSFFSVLVSDYSSCMQLLMHYPVMFEVPHLVQNALHLRNPVSEKLLP